MYTVADHGLGPLQLAQMEAQLENKCMPKTFRKGVCLWAVFNCDDVICL